MNDETLWLHSFYRHYLTSMVLMCFAVPTLVPWCLWGESLTIAYFVPGIFRYALTLNATWLVNSAAHMWGNRPYDITINPRENRMVSFSAMGELTDFIIYNSLSLSLPPSDKIFFFRWRLPQLPSHLSVRLQHQWVWLEAEPHHSLHRPHVYLGFSLWLQESVPGPYLSSYEAHRQWLQKKWLNPPF